MNVQDADTLIKTIRSLVEQPAPGADGRRAGTSPLIAGKTFDIRTMSPIARTAREATGPMGEHLKPFDDKDVERQYQAFKSRLIDEAAIDPVLLRLVMVQPEITVDVERRMVSVNGDTLRGRCARLIAGGWFNEARSTAGTRKELARTGSDPSGNNNLARVLSTLRGEGFLTMDGEGWLKAPGMKITETTITK